MDSFASLKRRTTDLFESIPKNMPSAPAVSLPNVQLPNVQMPSFQMPKGKEHTQKATWERISIPPLPRSSHSVDVVAGTAYLFGGEVNPRQPVDNNMHVIALPFSSAPADYYAIKPKAATPSIPTIEEPVPEAPEEDALPVSEPAEDKTEVKEQEKDLDDVDLGPPKPEPATDIDTSAITAPTDTKGKSPAMDITSPPDKGKSVARDTVPAARVGHASAVIGSRIFIFGGRSGASAPPLEEAGRVWVFDTKTHTWSALDPLPASNNPISPVSTPIYPAARSFHAAAAVDKPDAFVAAPPKRTQSWQQWAKGNSDEVGIPQQPLVGNVAARARDADADGYGTFIIAGGCLAEGRAKDVWAFDVRSRVWLQLPDLPGPPRGGLGLCVSRSRLYTFGGFDGTSELGGRLDHLLLGLDSFDDQSSLGEVALSARGPWQSFNEVLDQLAQPEVADAAEPLKPAAAWPGKRSVASLEAMTVGGGREYLVLMLGERDPSGSGHEAAGKFLQDVWVFQVPADRMSAASVTDTMSKFFGRKSNEGRWSQVVCRAYDEEDDDAEQGPGARGWVASAPLGEIEESGIVVFGGLDHKNSRLGDGWILRID